VRQYAVLGTPVAGLSIRHKHIVVIMSRFFVEELDYQKTALGDLVLRRRRSPSVPDALVYEVKLDDEMLMSSSVNASERELARLVLEGRQDRELDVLVGGLGLGYTAAAALEYANVRRLVVVELLGPVIGWHRRRLVPAAEALMEDGRCSVVEGDFFEYVARPHGEDRYDVILLDIDHSPDCWLGPSHRDFYTPEGLRGLTGCLGAGGVFGVWSAWKAPKEFVEMLGCLFASVREHEISFYNPHISDTDTNWVITAELGGS